MADSLRAARAASTQPGLYQVGGGKQGVKPMWRKYIEGVGCDGALLTEIYLQSCGNRDHDCGGEGGKGGVCDKYMIRGRDRRQMLLMSIGYDI